jgi:hypothetical protein
MIKDHEWTKEGAQLIQSLLGGSTDEYTRARAVDYIVNELGALSYTPLVPGSPDVTAFNIGRQWMARQLQIVQNTPANQLPIKKEAQNERRISRVSTATERAASRHRG